MRPVGRLAAVFAAIATAALAIRRALREVDAPSAGGLIDDHGYVGVAAGAFGDSFGLPSSGEIVLLLASAASAASASNFSLPVVIAVAWSFAVIGDATAYAIGRAAGPRVLRRFGVHEDSAVHGFMDRHGARAVTAGRLVAGIRTKLAVVSGSTRLRLQVKGRADHSGGTPMSLRADAFSAAEGFRFNVFDMRGVLADPLRRGARGGALAGGADRPHRSRTIRGWDLAHSGCRR